MGVPIIGGLLFSLVLTLFVIPAIYTFFNRKKQITSDELEQAEAAESLTSTVTLEN